MAAAVFQVAVLAGARIEQGTESVGGVGRRRRRDPVLAEDAVADLEFELALEIHVAGREREGVWRGGRAARGRAASRLVFAGLEPGEVGRGSDEGFDGGAFVFAMALKRAGKERQGRPERDRREAQDAARLPRRSLQEQPMRAIAETGMRCVHASFVRN